MPSTNNNSYLGSPDNPKTAAVVCYITLIGWLVAYFGLYRYNKTSFAALHLKQTLLLYIILFVVNALSYWVSFGLILVLDVIWTLLWLLGLFNAVNEREKPIPVVGDIALKLLDKI